MDNGIGLKNLEQALARYIEIGVESGTATTGTNTTLADATKNWEVNRWAGGDIHILKGGIEYVRTIASNTDTVITFAALPGGVSVAAGDLYSVRRITVPMDITDRWARQLGQIDLYRVLGADLNHANPVISRITDGAAFIDPRDVSDRAARLLGVIDSLTKWGGTALTGRDISLDLAKLDIALSALRDALRGAGTKDFTTLEADAESILAKLDVALSTRASEATLTSQLNITLSALRDALKGASAKDFSTLEADVEAILAQLDTVLSTRASEATLSTRASETTLAKLIPIAKAALFNTALPAAEANWLGADITPTNSPSYLRISVCVSVAGVLRVARSQGATTLTENLNSGNSLTADALYTFDVPWRTGDSINIRYSVTTGTIKRLIIDEFGAAI